MRVKDIMKSPVITISRGASLREAVALLSSAGVSGLPVIDEEGRLAGMVSEHDIIQALMPRYEDMLLSEPAILDADAMEARAAVVRDQPVSSIMTTKVVTLEEHETVTDAASVMLIRRVKRVPIVRGLKPVGIISRIDIVEAVMQGKLKG
jgi:CBS domain-containing protein